MVKLKITLQEYGFLCFPAGAVCSGIEYSNVFPNTELARKFLTDWFGAVWLVDRAAERQRVEKQAGGEEA